MLQFSTVKPARYFVIFVLGYTSAHFMEDRKNIESETLQPIAATTVCPTITPSCPPVAAIDSLHFSSAAPKELSQAPLDQNLQSSERQDALITDFDNPDEQIQLVLLEEPGAFTQMVEQIDEDQDPLAPLFLLSEDQQLGYIQGLVESQEDSAVVALNDLILSDKSPMQTAAIDGLISLLEMRTGHFAMIAENLDQNAVFLNEDQLRRLENAKLTATSP